MNNNRHFNALKEDMLRPDFQPKLEAYKNQLMRLNSHAWDGDKKWPEIEQWLNNFTGRCFQKEEEQLLALHLLTHFIYFGNSTLREMLKACYEEQFIIPLKQEIRKAHSNTTDTNLINCLLNQEINQTLFIGAGNPSESGAHLLYFFRQMNNLSKERFSDFYGAFYKDQSSSELHPHSPSIKRYIFFDDLVASGTQIKGYLKDRLTQIRTSNPSIKLQFMCLFATTTGLEALNTTEMFNGDAHCLFHLDDSYKVFSKKSRNFKSLRKPSRRKLKKFCQVYSTYLGYEESHKLGYKNSQLMIGFSYNTPDNTLPIFWEKYPPIYWTPIFARYSKIY